MHSLDDEGASPAGRGSVPSLWPTPGSIDGRQVWLESTGDQVKIHHKNSNANQQREETSIHELASNLLYPSH
jgi:hypothetical protein